MKGKSLAWVFLTLLVNLIGQYMGYFSPGVQVALGFVSIVGFAILQNEMLSSGYWPKGWTAAMWATQIVAVATTGGNYLVEHNLVDPGIINNIFMTANLFLVMFIKDYGQGSTNAVGAAEKKNKS